MKLCENHQNQLKTYLWMRGAPPQPGNLSPPGDKVGEPFAAALTLFYANIANQFKHSVMNAPADMCPCCENSKLENYLPLCAESIALQKRREAL